MAAVCSRRGLLPDLQGAHRLRNPRSETARRSLRQRRSSRDNGASDIPVRVLTPGTGQAEVRASVRPRHRRAREVLRAYTIVTAPAGHDRSDQIGDKDGSQLRGTAASGPCASQGGDAKLPPALSTRSRRGLSPGRTTTRGNINKTDGRVDVGHPRIYVTMGGLTVDRRDVVGVFPSA